MISPIKHSILLLVLLSSSLYAKVDSSLVREYMEISGANITIESMAQQVTTGITQTSRMYGERVDQKKIDFLKTVFNADTGIQIVENYLIKHFDTENIEKILAYYKSPLGSKVTQAALDATRPTAQADMYRFLAHLQSNPPSQKRTTLIKNMIHELRMVENMENVYASLIAYLNIQTQENKKLTNAQISELEKAMHHAFSQQMFLSVLYMYKDISHETLEKVITFYQTPAGEEELRLFTNAMSEMLKEGFLQALNR
jgi:hypothetical protein